MKKTITILTPTYNEEDNIDELYRRISIITAKNLNYSFEHLFIDNSSNDGTVKKIKQIAKKNKKVKLIVNARNFGADASIMHGMAQVQTDACIYIVSDLQDPPELIPDLIKKWEEGFKIVGLVKTESEESKFIFFLRKIYYRLLSKISAIFTLLSLVQPAM
jgi:glycosyltransferase involved in cell wall biosynthesis